MNRVRSEPDGLRIRLEGKLEVVEGALRRLQVAEQALAGPEWQLNTRWQVFGEADAELAEALPKVREVLLEEPGAPPTLDQLEHAKASFCAMAAKRLGELGFEVEANSTMSELTRLLRRQVPVITLTSLSPNHRDMSLRWPGVGKCFALAGLLVLPLVRRLPDLGLASAFAFFLGLAFIALRMLGGWAAEYVPPTRTDFALTPRELRVRTGRSWWVASLDELSVEYSKGELHLKSEGRAPLYLEVKLGAAKVLNALREHGVRVKVTQ